MAVAADLSEQLASLRIADSGSPPATWESIPSESGDGGPYSRPDGSNSGGPLYELPSISDAALVRLALFSLHGMKSSLMEIHDLAAGFCSAPADRTLHLFPNMWCRASSTCSVGKLLKSIGQTGLEVFFLQQFVNFHLFPTSEVGPQAHENKEENKIGHGSTKQATFSLVNQAFAVAVGKVLGGYYCSLDILLESVKLRRSGKSKITQSCMDGCVNGDGSMNSEVTLLEVFLHTEELRRHIKSLGNICLPEFTDLALSRECLNVHTVLRFEDFPRGADLLSFLYVRLLDADPVHYGLLKYLFVCSFEPYSCFMKSWIYEGSVNDPHGEFFIRHVDCECQENKVKHANADSLQFTSEDNTSVAVPSFLYHLRQPLSRTGQQLQVIFQIFNLAYLPAGGNNIHLPCDVSILDSILPCCLRRGTDSSLSLKSLNFSDKSIRAMVHEREAFYKSITENLESLVSKFEALPIKSAPRLHNRPVSMPGAAAADVHARPSSANGVAKNLERNVSADMIDEISFEDDSWQSSDCSFSCSSEESVDVEEVTLMRGHSLTSNTLPHLPRSTVLESSSRTNYISAPHAYLPHIPEQKSSMLPLHGCCECNDVNQNDLSVQWGIEEIGVLSETCNADLNNSWQPFGGLAKNPLSYSVYCGIQENASLHDVDLVKGCTTMSDSAGKNPWNPNNNFGFSINPTLAKYPIQDNICNSWGKSLKSWRGRPLFDFSTMADPFENFLEQKLLCHEDIYVESSRNGTCDDDPKMHQSFGNFECKVNTRQPGNVESLQNETVSPKNSQSVSSGACRENSLTYNDEPAHETVDKRLRDAECLSDMPLDVVIDKCIMQEVFLQYEYVSKFAIRLLEGGFDLREHFLALRRYHFMEVADWVDYFVMSLSCKTWIAAKLQQRRAEIQGLLELAIQKSACHSDPYKDRLFVFIKELNPVTLSLNENGLDVLNNILLGYRVDWPVSIIITDNALKIYANIFSFLIQVRHALFSLTKAWSSIKGLMEFVVHHKCSSPGAIEKLNFLMRFRQQLYHFISTLQQYVHCHLTDPSRSLCEHSIKHQVRDMLDLESLHLSYLADALKICFLCSETKMVGAIIRNILQCALELQSCFQKVNAEAALASSSLNLDALINVSQVTAIESKFESNLLDLFVLYRETPSCDKLGLSHFWGSLNYNEHFSSALGKKFGCCYS